MAKKSKKWDSWDVKSAASTLIEAQSIENDTRPGFYAAVKTALKAKVEAAAKAAMEAKVTAKLHGVFGGKK